MKTLYMVVEHFKNKDAAAVYRRFRDSGRMAPEGLVYLSSWVDETFERCYQLMETGDRRLLEQVRVTRTITLPAAGEAFRGLREERR